jgi:site-specific recombinase XerD
LGKREVMHAIGSLGCSRIEVRDRAVLWVATDSWCRASELVALRVQDICPQEDGTSLLYIAKSKTDQFGEGAYAFLSRRGTEAAKAWVDLACLKPSDPLFTKSQAQAKVGPLDAATISRIIKRCTGRNDVSAHSTRVGGVQDALKLGCDLSSIMVAGRWTSPEMPARYGRRLLASQSAAAKVSAAFSD